MNINQTYNAKLKKTQTTESKWMKWKRGKKSTLAKRQNPRSGLPRAGFRIYGSWEERGSGKWPLDGSEWREEEEGGRGAASTDRTSALSRAAPRLASRRQLIARRPLGPRSVVGPLGPHVGWCQELGVTPHRAEVRPVALADTTPTYWAPCASPGVVGDVVRTRRRVSQRRPSYLDVIF